MDKSSSTEPRAGPLDAFTAILVPIIARADECGEGPGGLADWLHAHAPSGVPGPLPPEVVHDLARRLAERVAAVWPAELLENTNSFTINTTVDKLS